MCTCELRDPGSDPVTALTTRHVRYGVEPDLIYQPGSSPGQNLSVLQ